MKLDFTEFSYGYAFTENLIRASSTAPAAAPVFPNLVQEAQLGYDVKVDLPGLPLFFQFKLPELMVRETAREISQLALRGLSVPFFRMPLMRRNLSDQHIHLIGLEARFPNTVFYASPTFDSALTFNNAYGFAEVHSRSALFSPTDIGPLPDDDAHAVSYASGSHVAWRCSEPKEVKALTFASLAQEVTEKLTGRAGRTLDDTTREIREGVWQLLSPELRRAENAVRDRIEARRQTAADAVSADGRIRAVTTEILVLQELSRVGLGVELLIAQPRKSKKATKQP
ncbi:MAG: hypothetical protein M9924_17695 [Rhizobiaceae bacterium]|nr:hypothetical protein [Rhizobiaceae bacterium]